MRPPPSERLHFKWASVLYISTDSSQDMKLCVFSHSPDSFQFSKPGTPGLYRLKQRRPPLPWQPSVYRFTFQPIWFSFPGNSSQLTTSTPSNTTIRAKSPTSNPASSSHIPAKETGGNFQPNVDCGELKHLILRVLTSFFHFFDATSTVLIPSNMMEWERK